MRFNEFSTQPGKDFVRVYDCTDPGCSQEVLLAELSGTYSTVQDVASRKFMKIVFTSDESETYDGFTANWTILVRNLHDMKP
jgi:hypothetical protein